jgi:DNA-binding NarL/FixJ family response regulator
MVTPAAAAARPTASAVADLASTVVSSTRRTWHPAAASTLSSRAASGVRARTTEVRATSSASVVPARRRPRDRTTTSSTVCATSLSRWLETNTVALRAGASGFLLKDTPPSDLLAGIRVVAAGDALLAPSVTRQLISEFVRRPDSDRPPPTTLDVLTGREREVLTLVARGWSNAEIAERLYLSPATAKTHVGRLLTKLQARDRTQLVVIAYESGLVTPSGA